MKKCVPANIPVFLIKDKIYSSLSFSEIVKSNLEQVFKSLLDEEKVDIGFNACVSYNFKSRGFLVECLNPTILYQKGILKE